MRLAAAFLGVLLLAAFSTNDPLSIGSKAPLTNVALTGTDGRTYTLDGAKGRAGLLVMFTCNTCPYVHAWENRFNGIVAEARQRGINVLLLNPNEALRGTTESMDAMRARAQEKGYTAPYVVDAGHRLADAFGATRTPEAFLFNADLELVYHGAIDDNARDADAVEQTFLVDAIRAVAAGDAPAMAETRSVGCTIKRTT